uniref:Uncharacterized protein n=1 Tax=Pristionchus pacificus TaxID=54126 RepID=A0A2A6CYB9_PRIPA|eukprot:PDM83214.1 hypothetical protein PRIPAC_34846 [Pristionchus pacificus]
MPREFRLLLIFINSFVALIGCWCFSRLLSRSRPQLTPMGLLRLSIPRNIYSTFSYRAKKPIDYSMN